MNVYILIRTIGEDQQLLGAYDNFSAAASALADYTDSDSILEAVQECIDRDWDCWHDFQDVGRDIDGDVTSVRFGVVEYSIETVRV